MTEKEAGAVTRWCGRDKERKQMKYRLRWLTLMAVMLMVMAACSSTDGEGGTDTTGASDPETTESADTTGSDTGSEGEDTDGGESDDGDDGGVAQRDIRIAVVTHGEPGSSFWAVVQNGAEAAANDLGVTVDYRNPDTFDLVRMTELIDAAIASEPDGLVVSIPDADAVGPNIQAAIDAGIPVVSMNSGGEVWQDLGALTHIGSDEFVAGTAAGERLAELGVTNAICVNDEVGNIALDIRCESATAALEAAGGTMTEVPAPTGDPIGQQAAVEAALQADPSIDGALSMSPDAAIPSLQALEEGGHLDNVVLATFDLGPDVLNAVEAGTIAFAVDQQQFLQGYLPVSFLTLYAENLLMPGGGQAVLTGPNFVIAETANEVLSLSEQGIR